MSASSPVVSAAGSLRTELARKAIHLASCTIPIAYALGTPRATMLVGLGILGVVALGLELARARSTRVRTVFVRTVGPLLRAHEHDALSGATWLLAAYALCVILFRREIAIAGMLAAGLGDASAAIVGRAVATARARRGVRARGKTLVGSVACAIATFVGASLVASLSPVTAIVAAIAASVVERIPLPLDDNVCVALGAGGGALFAEAMIRAFA